MTETAKPKKRQIKASVSKDASTETQETAAGQVEETLTNETANDSVTNEDESGKTQKFDINQLTPATAAIALIEGVELAQKAGIYSLEDAEVLSAARRILLSAIRVNNG